MKKSKSLIELHFKDGSMLFAPHRHWHNVKEDWTAGSVIEIYDLMFPMSEVKKVKLSQCMFDIDKVPDELQESFAARVSMFQANTGRIPTEEEMERMLEYVKNK